MSLKLDQETFDALIAKGQELSRNLRRQHASSAMPPLVERVDELRQRLAAQEQRIAHLAARLPPVGWRASNYVCDARPELSLCHNCETGRWSVWAPGRMIAEGATIEECLRMLTAAP